MNLENYTRLFLAEDTRFKMGESSLFLLNASENKMLEAMFKLIELQAKYLNIKMLNYRSPLI